MVADILIYEITKRLPVVNCFFGGLEPGATNNILMANNQAFLEYQRQLFPDGT
jgi:hypothetical protein